MLGSLIERVYDNKVLHWNVHGSLLIEIDMLGFDHDHRLEV